MQQCGGTGQSPLHGSLDGKINNLLCLRSARSSMSSNALPCKKTSALQVQLCGLIIAGYNLLFSVQETECLTRSQEKCDTVEEEQCETVEEDECRTVDKANHYKSL